MKKEIEVNPTERYAVVTLHYTRGTRRECEAEWEDFYDTLDDANFNAKREWSLLTRRAKDSVEIYVVRVTVEDLRRDTEAGHIPEEDWEDGRIPWQLPASYSIAEGGFNSEVALAKEIAERFAVDTDEDEEAL